MSFRNESSGFHAQCLTAILFGTLAFFSYIVLSTYGARSDPAGTKLHALLGTSPFWLTAITASVVALLIHKGKRITLPVKLLPMGTFLFFIVGAVVWNAL